MHNNMITLSLSFNEEKISGKGEDAALRALSGPNAAVLASMDGCGGAGAQRYVKAHNMTGARIAAMHVGMAVQNWFETNQYGLFGSCRKSAEELSSEIKNAIHEELHKQYTFLADETSGVQSSLVKTFPTTLAGSFLEVLEKNLIRCLFFWAGDSRTYFFPASGLQQTSVDDIRGRGDPFDALENDGILSNVVSYGKAYTLHTKELLIREPCMILTATDGCFSYYQSPMELEWILLDSLAKAESPVQWEEYLRSTIGAIAGDDHTMNIAVIGFGNWQALKNAYMTREETFAQKYYAPLQRILANQDRDAHMALWEQYKAEYLR